MTIDSNILIILIIYICDIFMEICQFFQMLFVLFGTLFSNIKVTKQMALSFKFFYGFQIYNMIFYVFNNSDYTLAVPKDI
jgi:hypothetical protein